MDDLQDGNISTEGRAVVSAAVAATHTKTLLFIRIVHNIRDQDDIGGCSQCLDKDSSLKLLDRTEYSQEERLAVPGPAEGGVRAPGTARYWLPSHWVPIGPRSHVCGHCAPIGREPTNDVSASPLVT